MPGVLPLLLLSTTLLPDLALAASTIPAINPPKASKPSIATKAGLQQVFYTGYAAAGGGLANTFLSV